MRKHLSPIGRLCLPLFLLSFSGCAGQQAGLADAAAIHLENHATGQVHVAWSDAHEVDGGLLVTGVVRRQDIVGPPIRTTVDVEIVSPSGDILDRAQSDSLCVPHRRTSRMQGFERFRVRLSRMPPEGSSLRITARGS